MTEPIPIKLKEKYLSATHGNYKSNHNDNGTHRKHKRVKVGPKEHLKRQGDTHRQMVLVLLDGRHRVFMEQKVWNQRYA